MTKPILTVDNLSVTFATRSGAVNVLDGVTFAVDEGQITSIVGESGCGKSMTALSILGLIPKPAGRISAGSILFRDRDLVAASPEEVRAIRGRDISMIFQEPMTSLNPVFTVGEQICETIRQHERLDRKAALDRAVEALRAVQIPSPEQRVRDYPHQLSGGMRQRVMIAMAIVCNPQILLADEPTTALDVTVAAEIFDLLLQLKSARGMSMILITHDMSSVSQVADSVVVMYAGRVVEKGPTAEILGNPQHPYTQALIACIPDPDDDEARTRLLQEIPGIVPNLADIGIGCPFAERCAVAMPRCSRERPPYVATGPNHGAACWLVNDGVER
jgi:peptide/nickel transport system ATP-binding protein